jgi:ATP-binding cassette subfamily B multidrug efflux pump
VRPIFPYLKPHVPKMTLGLVIKFFGTIMDLMIPWMLSYVLDYVVPERSVKKILMWGGLMVLSAAVALVTNVVANRMASAVARETTRSLRHDLFSKISYLSSRQIDYFSIPSLESRLTTDTYNVNQVIGMMQRLGVRAPILLVGGIAVTLTLEPMLTLVMISVLPFITLVVWLVSRKGIPMYTHLQQGVDTMVRTVRENITGIRIIKALSKTEQEKEHFAQVNREVVRRESKAAITMGITNPMMNLLLNTGLTLVILVGAWRVNGGMTQPGTIIAFLSYFTIILNAMLSVTRMFVMYSRGSASAARIDEVLSAPEDLLLNDTAPKQEEEHIVFENVSFSYKGISDNLSHISFRLRQGETLGIIGATGSGKTTIINLLMRLYERSSGDIRIGGRPVDTIPPEELHQKFGVVFQNDVLFADTIRANIDFGRGLSEEQIQKAAKSAQAMEFISSLPEGMEHMVTARGTNLSGGQKQRVLLARALAGNSEILVLDDSSSALDYKTDSMLRQALREHYTGVTTIVIAQRISSILHADHILVLDEGKEIGYGTHEQLMESCEVYRQISESQMGGDFG